ncbi:MAG: hypothetical protein J5515_01435 [Lachnospiraceae bacterium]|nr:hypothetical protein [Lachnospiraceae bacterium]
MNENDLQTEEAVNDYEKQRSEDYKKYRDLYKLIREINRYEGIQNNFKFNTEAFDKLRNHELYREALKSKFFIDKLSESVTVGGFNSDMAEMIEADVDLLTDVNPSDYSNLRKALGVCGRQYKSKGKRKEIGKEYIIFSLIGIAIVLVGFLIAVLGVLIKAAILILIGLAVIIAGSGFCVFARLKFYLKIFY